MSALPEVPGTPDPAQVQRLIVYGCNLDYSRHFVLHVTDAEKARAFIGALAQRVSYAVGEWKDVNSRADRGDCPISVGITYLGLKALEVPTPYLRVFQEKAKAFAEGAVPRAARRLADTGPSATACWEPCFRDPDAAHVLLSLHGNDEPKLDKACEDLRALAGEDGLAGWDSPHEGEHLTKENRDVRIVHFGLRDGIANPRARGFPPGDDSSTVHAPGEFLLGYWNDEKFNAWLLVNPAQRFDPWQLPLAQVDRWLFWNGSFGAFRKMEQDVAAFSAFEEHWKVQLNVKAEYVRAKLVGRWNDGSVVQPGETESPYPSGDRARWKPSGELNDFDFAKDPQAQGCPFGSHIRRMNPRADQVAPSRRRPLIRRGMPYGPAYAEGEASGKKRGMLGMFFCASLEDQFEHLLAEWGNLNPMGPNDRGSAKDPVMGNHEDPDAIFDIPMPAGEQRQLDGLRPFTRTRGTLYAFYPSRRALHMIANRCEIKK